MTPAEKAKEIYNKFYGIPLYIKTIKECCHICVNEILSINPFSFYDKKFHLDKIKEYESYWKEVKQEIEKL